MKIIKSISKNKKVSRFGKQIQLVTKCIQLRVPFSCTAMTGLRRCCSDGVPYCYWNEAAGFTFRQDRAKASKGLSCMLSCTLSCTQADRYPPIPRSLLAPTSPTHPTGVPPHPLFYVRVAHTQIFYFAYLRQISNPIPDQPPTKLYTQSGMNLRLTPSIIPARL